MTTKPPQQLAREMVEKCANRLLHYVLGGRRGLDYREIIQDEEIEKEVFDAVSSAIERSLSLTSLLEDKQRLDWLDRTGHNVNHEGRNVDLRSAIDNAMREQEAQ